MANEDNMKAPMTACVVAVCLAWGASASAQERMSMIPADRQTDAQKKAVADYKALRGADLTGPPWSVLLRVPDHIAPALQIRLHYLNKNPINPQLPELALPLPAHHRTH